MASLRRNMNLVVVTVAAVAMLLTVSGARSPRAMDCAADGAVFPYVSRCNSPARYYGEEVYTLTSSVSYNGSLAPEYDESNSTYYVRLADEGAQYKLSHFTKDYRPYVSTSDDVVLVNVESGMSLGWRQEGGEYFLVETESLPARFQFAEADSVSLPCILIYPPVICKAYYLVALDDTSTGLSPYEEDGATYFKKGSDLLPFLILRSSESAKKSMLAARA